MRSRISALQILVDVLGRLRRISIKKLKRGTVSSEEVMRIAKTLDVRYEQAFVPESYEIKIGSKE